MKPVRQKEILHLYHQALSGGQALALFRLPGTKTIYSINGRAERSLKPSETGFAFAPFDPKEKPYYIYESVGKRSPKPLSDQKLKSTSKKQFNTLVNKIAAAIESSGFKKIVAARVLAVEKPSGFNPIAFFEQLCATYSSAFVSLTYIPGVGLWIGASPEVLVSASGKSLTVYSLAGTKAINDQSPWTAKEQQEQEIVTGFIQKKLSKITDTAIKIKGPVTQEAGHIKHLLTVFTIPSNHQNLWQQTAKALHPTPAVAGMPRQKAVDFIKGQELFDRRFYAGYLGPVNYKDKTSLFVNLRCMEVTEKQLLFYAGCGITTGSYADKEWIESERKIEILKGLV